MLEAHDEAAMRVPLWLPKLTKKDQCRSGDQKTQSRTKIHVSLLPLASLEASLAEQKQSLEGLD